MTLGGVTDNLDGDRAMSTGRSRPADNQRNQPESLHARYGPWVVIAGASEGLGAEFARQLAAAGFNCILIARRGEVLDQLAAELRQNFGIEALGVAIDLAAPDATARMLAAVAGRQVGLFIYNAGGSHDAARFLQAPARQWTPLVNRNVVTLMESVHAFGTLMVNAGRGGIILVGSEAAFGGVPRLNIYSATKAFVLNFGESLWAELAPQGVHVLNLVISATDTPTLRDVLRKNDVPAESIAMSLPSDVVPAALAHLDQGPTYVHGFAEDVADTVKSSRMRRDRVLQSAEFVSLFFGKDP
jgi:short-subunit dehydrogenase